ncbi:transposase-like protein [Agrobacterium larrymoorei]|uniref:Transposase-like protein n=1 Tax=Agrobacterium larrymoorei TaxID=160699 RepID=A0AAJ2BDE7_9HYPH|nr:IS481 family transposase [Agrobacterium larrymoorei]MDR6100926.1 transposase-like protein [Agrobacterium larrymoorei]
MGQVLRGRATTTEAIRRAIQHSQESLRALSKRYGINLKTVSKWRKRTSVADLATGPKEPHSTILSLEEKAVIVAFQSRRHTLLPLDYCLYALQPTIPHLTRSSLRRCLQRNDISRLPEVAGDKEPKKKFKSYPIGYFHIDIAEVQTAEGKLYLFVAIDRTSKFAFVELYAKAGKTNTAQFLRNLVKAVPYAIHKVLTDNGIEFTNRACDRYAFNHIFDRVCDENNIEHRLTKVKHPWTNGQVERMNRTVKDATVKRFHDGDHEQLKKHLADFIDAYNFGRRLKTLKGLTPYEFICKRWASEPDRFIIDLIHKMPGPNTLGRSFSEPLSV